MILSLFTKPRIVAGAAIMAAFIVYMGLVNHWAEQRAQAKQEAASNAARIENIQEAQERENEAEALDDDCLAATALGRVCGSPATD